MASPSKLEIIVTGSGHTIRRAERAILVLQATSNSRSSPSEASSEVTHAANLLREAIMPHCPVDEETGVTLPGAAIAHYSMSSIGTSIHNKQRQNTDTDAKPIYDYTYSARAEFHIKFAAFDVLDKLATQFSAMENVEIKRIEWKLTDATLESIESNARKFAANDAIQKAHDYAEVFSSLKEEDLQRRVQAVDIKEDNYYAQSTRPQLHYGKAQRMDRKVMERPALQFQPEDVRLDIKVNAKFVVVD